MNIDKFHAATLCITTPSGYGQTISAPHMHVACLEMLEPYLKPGNKALDVGSGSGIFAVAMALMVGPTGKVIQS